MTPKKTTNQLARKQPVLKQPELGAVALLPTALQQVAKEAALDPQMNDRVRTFMERANEFSSPAAAMLAGIACNPFARRMFDDFYDSVLGKDQTPPRETDRDVVIGAGLHAAIYCAVRVKLGFPAPIVLERESRAGGAFAVSRGPAFYMNSRNRPGPLSIPGDLAGSLNHLPESMVQVADMGGEEYPDNAQMAWAIRTMLAMNATVYTDVRTESASVVSGGRVRLARDGVFFLNARRVVIATGLNNPKDTVKLRYDNRVMNFAAFMRLMDTPFPLRGMKRVAVIGAGNSGMNVIETLCGQGPTTRYSVAALDRPETIDWYGCPVANCAAWMAVARTRYKRIGSLLPRDIGVPARVTPKPRAEAFARGYECVYINFQPYDFVVDCTGYLDGSTVSTTGCGQHMVDRRVVGLKSPNGDLFIVGPAAQIPVDGSEETVLRGLKENRTALFRLAGRTAALAASLK